MLEMPTVLNSACIHSLPHVTSKITYSFCHNIQDRVLDILFQFIKGVWIVFINVLVYITPQKVWRRDIRRSRRPQSALWKKKNISVDAQFQSHC